MGPLRAVRLDANRMRVRRCREFDAAHICAVHKLDAACARLLAEMVLEDAAVDLPGRRRQHLAHAELGDVADVVAAVAEEEAEAELAHVRRVEMRAQAERVREVVRADLDRRFADLVRRNRHRMRAAFDHADREVREAVAQLQCERESGEAAAEDHDIRFQVSLVRFAGHCALCPSDLQERN